MFTTSLCSLISRMVFVLGTETSMPDCKIGAVIMNMISKTSITSTKGTMLMSESEVSVWRLSCGITSLSGRGHLQRVENHMYCFSINAATSIVKLSMRMPSCLI